MVVDDSVLTVGYLALAPFISGAERSLQCLVHAIVSESIRPVIFSPAASPLHDWAKQEGIVSYALPLELFGAHSITGWLKTQLLLTYYCRRERVRILHSNQHWSVKPINTVRRRLGLKLVTHFRDNVADDLDWWLSGAVDASVFISHYMSQQILEHASSCDLGVTQVIVNPVMPSGFSTVQESVVARNELRQQLGLGIDEFVYAFLGQISPVKGVLELIQAFASVVAVKKRLIIAGSPTPGKEDYYQLCLDRVRALQLEKNVTFLGFVDDPGSVYTVANVVVLPSHSEPLGRVPLEAAAHYRPTVATNVGGLPETIKVGESGWLVPLGDIDALSGALNVVLNTDLVGMGSACKAWSEAVASPEKYAKAMSNLYRNLL